MWSKLFYISRECNNIQHLQLCVDIFILCSRAVDFTMSSPKHSRVSQIPPPKFFSTHRPLHSPHPRDGVRLENFRRSRWLYDKKMRIQVLCRHLSVVMTWAPLHVVILESSQLPVLLYFSLLLYLSQVMASLLGASKPTPGLFSTSKQKIIYWTISSRRSEHLCSRERQMFFPQSSPSCVLIHPNEYLHRFQSAARIEQLTFWLQASSDGDWQAQATYVAGRLRQKWTFFSGNEKEIICRTRLRTSYSWQVILSATGHHQAATGCLIKK